MQNMLDNDQAEPAPPLPENKERWYLPTFGVYHPQKPEQIRVVFDSSAECDGISLNQVLLSGPDLNNSLLGVLLRFRKEPTALTADVQQMFYCFVVREDHRDYLRYLWYENNDLAKNIVEFRMKVHVFGNSPSPAVAIYCMRRAAQQGEQEHGSQARQFVERQFYIDDGLTSVATPEEAIDLLVRTQNMLAESNLRLHKVASNSGQVMEALPAEDRAKDLKDLDLAVDPLPVQRSLGLCWNLQSDSFTYQVSNETKPFTQKTSGQRRWKSFNETPSIQELAQAKVVIIKAVQQDAYKETLKYLKEGQKNLKHNTLKKLNPVFDDGGRLSSADFTENEKHPLIIPSNNHIATLLVGYFHEEVSHQGRHSTEGAVRGAGYWIVGGKRLISSAIHKCVACRKLRGKMQAQKMADLPRDRVTPEPPFTTVGLDVFGPWTIVTRHTTGGCAQSKCWAVLFTCMS